MGALADNTFAGLYSTAIVCLFQYVAMAAAWLASKIEEAGLRLKNLIPVFQRVDAKRSGKKSPPLDPTSDVSILIDEVRDVVCP